MPLPIEEPIYLGTEILNGTDGDTDRMCFNKTKRVIDCAAPLRTGLLSILNGIGTLIEPVPIPLTLDNASAIDGVVSGRFIPAAPTIQNLSQSSGYLDGTMAIIIHGTGLLSTTGVTFGGQRCQWLGITDSAIICACPPVAVAGNVEVEITLAVGPGQGPTTITGDFTYSAKSFTDTLTNQFRQTGDPSSFTEGTYYTGPASLGIDSKIWFPDANITGSLPGIVSPSAAIFNFTTAGTLKALANQLPYYYATSLTHEQHGTCLGSDGSIWSFDHHGTVSRNTSLNSGAAYAVQTYCLLHSGDQSAGGVPIGIFTGPDGWLWLPGATATGGVLWRVNPLNPNEQTRRAYPGVPIETNGSIQANGNVFFGAASTGGVAPYSLIEIDISQNIVSTTPIAGFPTAIILGNDLNLWMIMYGNNIAVDPMRLVRISRSNLTNQLSLNLPTPIGASVSPGSDGNIWVACNRASTGLDSLLIRVSLSNAILDTFTLTGSVGPSPGSHPGGAEAVIIGSDGAVNVLIGQDPAAGLPVSVVTGFNIKFT